MNTTIEAQHTLRNAITDAHVNATIAGLDKIGIEVTDWDDALTRADQINTQINTYSSVDDEWHIGSVVYNQRLSNRREYQIGILGASSVSLIESGATDDGFKLPFAPITHPNKFIDLQLHYPDHGLQHASVFITPDAPALAVHGDDIEYVSSGAQRLDHHEIGIRIVPLVEEAFGEDAVEVLSSEACTALGAAIRAADRELAHVRNSSQYLHYL